MSPAHAEPGPPNHVLLSVLVLRAASPAQGEDLEVGIIRGEDSYEAGVVLRGAWHGHKIYFRYIFFSPEILLSYSATFSL
jgi:hypothetical protein